MKKIEKKELIDYRLYDPSGFNLFGKKSDKAVFTTVHCSNSKNCELYKRGKCALWHGVFHVGCEYGNLYKETGYTTRAKKSYQWINTRRERVKGISQLASPKKIATVGNKVFLPYQFWKIAVFGHYSDKQKSHYWIDKSDFNIEFVLKLIKSVPRDLWDNSIITKYQKEVVPRFISHLKELLPDTYDECYKASESFREKADSITFIGRTAKVITLVKGSVIKVASNYYKWDGEKLISERDECHLIEFKGYKTIIIPNDKSVIKITNDNQADEGTEFID